ncbi:predicted protein [Botrytis cinerea T4]|uniref:Uncharacterized protein n=1 Tax=Botryotinia fuckeliana (strain T4) TaxID=999810 RepID=G2XZ37_BOTF4|nr:predicted protein [Botrytis cinerea T4]
MEKNAQVVAQITVRKINSNAREEHFPTGDGSNQEIPSQMVPGATLVIFSR